MADSDKRLQYYHGQFLRKEDFIEEQAYHIDRLRRHNRQLHTYGIAEGLTVTAGEGAASATVEPGTAIDKHGRQIVLTSPRPVPFGTRTGSMLVVISYREKSADPAEAGSGDQGDTRWVEDPDIELISVSGAPPADVRIQLAKLRLDDGRLAEPQDKSVRTSAGVKLGTDVEVERIRLPRQGVASNLWPTLSSGAQNRLDVTSDLSVTGNVLVTGTVDGRDVSADGAKLDTHAASTNNPHNTTAAQVGAITGVGGVSNAGGNIEISGSGSITVTPSDAENKITISETHSARKDNPHNTTAAQVGAITGVGGVSNAGGNIEIAGSGAITVTANDATNTILISETHASSTNNPHNTTAAQVGAITGINGITNPGGQVTFVAGKNIQIDSNAAGRQITVASSSIKGISKPGGDIDLIGVDGITVTPDIAANTIRFAGTSPKSISGVSNPGGNIEILGSGGITVTPNDNENKITVSGSPLALGALPSSAYLQRSLQLTSFNENDADGTIRTINTAFRPKLISMEGAFVGFIHVGSRGGGEVGGFCHCNDGGGLLMMGHGPQFIRYSGYPYVSHYNEFVDGRIAIAMVEDKTLGPWLRARIGATIIAVTDAGFGVRLIKEALPARLPGDDAPWENANFILSMAFAILG